MKQTQKLRVAASSLNPLEYKLADLNFMGRTPPVVLGLDLAGVVVAVGHGVSGVAVGDAVAAMAGSATMAVGNTQTWDDPIRRYSAFRPPRRVA